MRPSDLTLKAMNVVHRGILGVTRGRVGWNVAHMPALELTTTGRRTGRPHSVMLTSPLQEGTTIVLVASRGGTDQHPAWFLNLSETPEVEIRLGGAPKQHARAHVASPEERARLWPQITAAHERYAGYQAKTQREIPVVLLDPI